MSNWAICENEPKTNPNKPNACPPRRLEGLSAISVAGQRKKMLPRTKINSRRDSFCYYSDENTHYFTAFLRQNS